MEGLGKAFVYLVRFIRVVLGLALIATFLWALGDQKSLDDNYGMALGVLEDAADQGILTISADTVEPSYEGQFVHVQGDLKIGNAHDPLTGLSLQAVRLVRFIEMLQWEEEAYRLSGQTGGIWHYRWNKVWSDRIIDSDSFKKVDLYFDENRDNPKKMPQETKRIFHPSHLTLGAWPLQITFTDRLATDEAVSAEMLKSAELADGWYVAGNGNYLYPPQNSTSMASDQVGTIRIRYRHTALDEGPYSAVGLVKDGKLDDTIYDRVYGLPLMAVGDVSSADIVEQTVVTLGEGWALQKNWVGYVFVGLLLCIGVIARLFPFLKGFTEAPFQKRAVITVIVAAFGTAIAGALV